MSLIIKNNGGGSKPLEPGTYMAVCCGLIDIGWQYSEQFGSSSPKVVIMWEIPDEKIVIDGEEKSRVISSTYTMSLNEKANLRKTLSAWRGKDFTAEELKGFNLASILGVPCMLNIAQRESTGKTFVSGVMQPPKGTKKPKGTMAPILFDLDNDPLEKMETLPAWIQDTIKKSETYKDRLAGIGHGEEEGEDIEPTLEEVIDESDLPF